MFGKTLHSLGADISGYKPPEERPSNSRKHIQELMTIPIPPGI